MAKKTAKQVSKKKSAPSQSTEEINSSLTKFFIGEIKDIYWAEKHLTKALPKMKKAATSTELQKAFETHLKQTNGHIARLEKVFRLLKEKAQAKKCDAMAGIVEECQGIIEDTEAGTATRDVGLILGAQKVEHYEISTYGGLAQLARTIDQGDIADLLETTLEEEKETDLLLTDIAENHVNYDASQED